MKQFWKSSSAGVAMAAMLANSAAFAGTTYSEPALTFATSTNSAGYQQQNVQQTKLTMDAKIALLRQKVKYVFVIFQENRSFDHYFGSYPGANGLYATYTGANASDPYAQPASAQSSFASKIGNVDGSYGTVTPWRLPRQILNTNGNTVNIYPESLLSVDHSHSGYMNDFDLDTATKSVALNDGYPLDQEGLHYGTPDGTVLNSSNVAPTAAPTLQAKQKGEVVFAHADCDTIPLYWQLADRFTLFDNMHQTATGPSTPNAIAILAGQVGDTQWVKHPGEANTSGPYLPMLTDAIPFPGSTSDTWSGKPGFGVDDGSYNAGTNSFAARAPSSNFPLTFASLPLSFMGSQIAQTIRYDQHRTTDLLDVGHDIVTIATKDQSVAWGWYEQGFGPEPFDGTQIYTDDAQSGYTTPPGAPIHASLITHHVGPQYFGYLADNSAVYVPATGTTTPSTAASGNLHGLQQFFTDINAGALSSKGGVYYVRGGYYNNDGLTPVDPNVAVQHDFTGNDDHGSYSDSQISEAMAVDAVNAIVNSSYWSQSAIILTYDESDGFYDHVPEQFRTWGPDGLPETGGPRIPTIVISPYSAAHTVSHVYSEHSSVIKFINELFNLVPLANLPDEKAARALGATKTGAFLTPAGNPQTNLGPADDLSTMGDLLEAFDNDRLTGAAPVLSAQYAAIPASVVHSLPHLPQVSAINFPAGANTAAGAEGAACAALGIQPTDVTSFTPSASTGSLPVISAAQWPVDFNPRPTVSLGSPYYNTSGNTAAGSATGTGSPWPN